MVISNGNQNIICETEASFEKSLREQLMTQSAEIWVSENGLSEEYPCIGILISGEKASITYFGDDGSCFVSVGDGSDSEILSFCDGQFEVAGNQIVDKNATMPTLKEFFNSHGRSDYISWEQLY